MVCLWRGQQRGARGGARAGARAFCVELIELLQVLRQVEIAPFPRLPQLVAEIHNPRLMTDGGPAPQLASGSCFERLLSPQLRPILPEPGGQDKGQVEQPPVWWLGWSLEIPRHEVSVRETHEVGVLPAYKRRFSACGKKFLL